MLMSRISIVSEILSGFNTRSPVHSLTHCAHGQDRLNSAAGYVQRSSSPQTMLTVKSSTCLISFGSIAGPRRSILAVRFDGPLHFGRCHVEMRCIPDCFAVTQDDDLWRFVANAGPARKLARNVTRRLHLDDIDAVNLLHLAVRARADRTRVAVLEDDDGFLRRVCEKVFECVVVIDFEKAVSHSSVFPL